MKNHRFIKRADKQRGAVLVVSLLLLVVMTLLGLGASQSTRLQERMAGNQRDLELAMQSGEASLRAAEALLLQGRSSIVTCVAATRSPSCETYEANTLVDTNGVALDLTRQSDTWWQNFGRTYEFAASLAQVSTTPEYVNERVAETKDTLSQGGSYLTVVRDFHRSTARSTGLTNTAQVVVQSTYSRVTFE